MCSLCNGTHVIHEVSSYAIRTSCCPKCGPESEESWKAGIQQILESIIEKREENQTNDVTSDSIEI